MALAQIRGHLSQGLCRRPRSQAGIAHWFAFYNGRRPHQALGNRTPMAVWREGTTGALGETAVDMTLRLDNAGALPTCPQPQQPQELVA